MPVLLVIYGNFEVFEWSCMHQVLPDIRSLYEEKVHFGNRKTFVRRCGWLISRVGWVQTCIRPVVVVIDVSTCSGPCGRTSVWVRVGILSVRRSVGLPVLSLHWCQRGGGGCGGNWTKRPGLLWVIASCWYYVCACFYFSVWTGHGDVVHLCELNWSLSWCVLVKDGVICHAEHVRTCFMLM